jgi:hypothetical protein
VAVGVAEGGGSGVSDAALSGAEGVGSTVSGSAAFGAARLVVGTLLLVGAEEGRAKDPSPVGLAPPATCRGRLAATNTITSIVPTNAAPTTTAAVRRGIPLFKASAIGGCCET